jgi:hypothetical protein
VSGADFSGQNRGAVAELLGPEPVGTDGMRYLRDYRWRDPREWPEALAGMTFLYRAFARLLAERGGTVEAAQSIRHDLQGGALRAVAIAPDGQAIEIDPQNWRGAGSRLLYWTAKSPLSAPRVGTVRCDVYLSDAAPAPEPEKRPDDLSPRERNTVHRMLLGMAMGGYGYRPGARGHAVADIVSDLEARGLAVSDDTVRAWLRAAAHEVYDPDADTSAKPN